MRQTHKPSAELGMESCNHDVWNNRDATSKCSGQSHTSTPDLWIILQPWVCGTIEIPLTSVLYNILQTLRAWCGEQSRFDFQVWCTVLFNIEIPSLFDCNCVHYHYCHHFCCYSAQPTAATTTSGTCHHSAQPTAATTTSCYSAQPTAATTNCCYFPK